MEKKERPSASSLKKVNGRHCLKRASHNRGTSWQAGHIGYRELSTRIARYAGNGCGFFFNSIQMTTSLICLAMSGVAISLNASTTKINLLSAGHVADCQTHR